MYWNLFWVVLWVFFYCVARRKYKNGDTGELYWMGFAMFGIIGSVCDLVQEALKHV